MPTTIEKIYQSVMSGMQDNNIKFKDLQNLLIVLGFQQKENNGSHFLYNYIFGGGKDGEI